MLEVHKWKPIYKLFQVSCFRSLSCCCWLWVLSRPNLWLVACWPHFFSNALRCCVHYTSKYMSNLTRIHVYHGCVHMFTILITMDVSRIENSLTPKMQNILMSAVYFLFIPEDFWSLTKCIKCQDIVKFKIVTYYALYIRIFNESIQCSKAWGSVRFFFFFLS